MNEIRIKNNEYLYNHLIHRNASDQPKAFMRHSHSYYEIIFFEKGEATYIVEDRKYILKPYDLIFIKPHLYHFVELQPNSEYQRCNIAFEKDFLQEDVFNEIERIELINCSSNSIIAEDFRRMDYYSTIFKEKDYTNLFRGLLTEIIYNIGIPNEVFQKEPLWISPLLTKILSYINNNLKTIRSVQEISDHFFIAESYLFKLFKNQLKISPKKYINMKRLLHAQLLLRSGQKPMEVYLECGFETYTGFYKQYKQTFGCSPSEENSKIQKGMLSQ